MERISCSLVTHMPLVLSFLLFSGLVRAENHERPLASSKGIDSGVDSGYIARGDTLENTSFISAQPFEIYFDADVFLRGCMQNYGSKAVRRVKDQWSETGVCLERIFFTNRIEEQSDGLLIRILSGNGTTSNMNDAPITSLCNNYIPDIEQCIQSFIVALKGCTGVQGDQDLQSMGHALSGAMNYACQHDGDRIVRFVAGSGPECLKEPHDTKILNCIRLRRSFLNQLQGNENNSIFQKEYCRIHEESNECIVQEFERCTNPSSTVKDIVRGLLSSMMNETKCRSNIHTVNEGGRLAYSNNSYLVFLFYILLCMHRRPYGSFPICSW